jgi:hypothetical protein
VQFNVPEVLNKPTKRSIWARMRFAAWYPDFR